MKNKVGQITIKKIGKKFAVCISGTPQELKNSWDLAKKVANDLRKKHGRRMYNYKKRKNSGKRK